MRRHAPATSRNRDPILEVLRRVLPDRGRVLEIAAGTGEHALHFAAAFPGLEWQPTDPDAAARESIAAWRDAEGTPNLRAPLDLDVTQPAWPLAQAAAVVAINMIHISPIEASEGLMRGAGAILPSGAPLVTYGPYRIDGAHTAPSNAAFDESLKARDPRWGVRDLAELEALAAAHGLHLEERVTMPANNFTLVWRKQSAE
ncbi:MAG: SAM-dependent methyltransferase [Sandaracinus sp.]|nr:SAM-dependent methyltransferase [Sandaracinus sp.]|tara:strand:- start:2300 stop:2902 length:603 start_codon:yes stop_codon:yes gene_type:complete